MLEGTSLGAASDENGNYLIKNIPIGSYTLIAMFIGYETFEKEVRVESEQQYTIDLSLKPSAIELQETKVTGEKRRPVDRRQTARCQLCQSAHPRVGGRGVKRHPHRRERADQCFRIGVYADRVAQPFLQRLPVPLTRDIQLGKESEQASRLRVTDLTDSLQRAFMWDWFLFRNDVGQGEQKSDATSCFRLRESDCVIDIDQHVCDVEPG